MAYKGVFKCTIMSSKSLVYENEITSIFLTGDRGEYELLAYHYPTVGIIQKSDIIINWAESIPVKGGVMRFLANECVVMVEEEQKTVAAAGKR